MISSIRNIPFWVQVLILVLLAVIVLPSVGTIFRRIPLVFLIVWVLCPRSFLGVPQMQLHSPFLDCYRILKMPYASCLHRDRYFILVLCSLRFYSWSVRSSLSGRLWSAIRIRWSRWLRKGISIFARVCSRFSCKGGNLSLYLGDDWLVRRHPSRDLVYRQFIN